MKTIDCCTFLTLAVITMSVSSCSPVLYSTVGQNVPLFKEKGEVAVSVGFMSSSSDSYALSPGAITESGGFNAQVAVAVDSSVAVMSSLYTLGDNGDWRVSGSYFEFGVGKFKHNPVSKLTGEIFVGAGYGSIKNSLDVQQINANFLKVFIQPSGGFSSKVIDMALTPRIALINYFPETSNETDPVVNDFFEEKKTSLVFEPGVTIRIGFKNVKLQYQMNYTTLNYSADEFEPVNKFYASLNLFILFTKRWNKTTDM